MMKMIFDQGVALLVNTGKNEQGARTCIGTLLRDYESGYVAAAIDTAVKNKDLVNPFPWLVGYLKKYPKKDGSFTTRGSRGAPAAAGQVAPTPQKVRPLATPEYLGLSDGLMRKIDKQNEQVNWTVPLAS